MTSVAAGIAAVPQSRMNATLLSCVRLDEPLVNSATRPWTRTRSPGETVRSELKTKMPSEVAAFPSGSVSWT